MSSKTMNKKAKIIIASVVVVVLIALAIVLPIVLKKKPTPNVPVDNFVISTEQETKLNGTLGSIVKLGVAKVGLSEKEYVASFEEGKTYEDYIFYKIKSDLIVGFSEAVKKAKITTSAFTALTGYIEDLSDELAKAIADMSNLDDQVDIETTFTKIYLEVMKALETVNKVFAGIEASNISASLIGDSMYFFIDEVFTILQKNTTAIETYITEKHFDMGVEGATDFAYNEVELTIATLGLQMIPYTQTQFRDIGIDTISTYYEQIFTVGKELTNINLALIGTLSQIYEGNINEADYIKLIVAIEDEVKALGGENNQILTIPTEYYDLLKNVTSKTVMALKLFGYKNAENAFVGVKSLENTEIAVNNTYKAIIEIIGDLKSANVRDLFSRNEILIEKEIFTSTSFDYGIENPRVETKIENARTLQFVSFYFKYLDANFEPTKKTLEFYKKTGAMEEAEADKLLNEIEEKHRQYKILADLPKDTIIFDYYGNYTNPVITNPTDYIIDDFTVMHKNINEAFGDSYIVINNGELKDVANIAFGALTGLIGLPVLVPFAIPTIGVIIVGQNNVELSTEIDELLTDLIKIFFPIKATEIV